MRKYVCVSALQISLVHDINSGKPRGYAFVEYEHERDMHCKFHCLPLAACRGREDDVINHALINVTAVYVVNALSEISNVDVSRYSR